MKRMRQLLAGFLTAAMVITTGIPAQAGSLDESWREKVKTEMVQDDSSVENLEETAQDDTAGEDLEQTVQDDCSVENPEEMVQDDTTGENLEQMVQINGNEDTGTANEVAEDGSDEPIATYGLARDIDYITIQSVATGKYVKASDAEGGTPVIVDGNENETEIQFLSPTVPNYDKISWVFASKAYPGKFLDSGHEEFVAIWNSSGGWESMRVFPNGDGTVSFKNAQHDYYISLDRNTNQMVSNKEMTADKLSDNERFIIYGSVPIMDAAYDLEMTGSTLDTIDLSWKLYESKKGEKEFICTNNILYWKKSSEDKYINKKNIGLSTSCQIRGLETGSYDFKIVTVNGQGDPLDDTVASEGVELKNCSTKLYRVPEIPENIEMEQLGNGNLKLSWKASKYADYYVIQHGESRFDTGFADMTAEDGSLIATTETTIEVTPSENPYQDYYRVVAVSGGTPDEPVADEERSKGSDGIGPEMDLFGRHTLILSPKDEVEKVDALLDEVFEGANDFNADAQFNGDHWQVYFKPGDYTETKCMYLGFYTSFNGLGKTPYDVRLNNIAIPAYLPNGELGGNGDNATCNFWRSAENLSVINTGNDQGKETAYGSGRPDYFNWAVAQAAPLRRVYSERPVAEDWHWGWASGGYVADCYFADTGDECAGTHSGQQFYTRNTKMDGKAYGTTLNNFFQGVEAPNLFTSEDWGDRGTPLLSNEGYSTWNIAAGDGGQRVFTSITNTEKISEKPFLYLNDKGEYEIFVPAVRKNVKGISWSNKNMGEGESLPLEKFYIAKPEDTAKVINAQLAAGKNIYFTPGIYHAEEPIQVTNPNTILLGTGMTTIIPDNEKLAMEVADVDGIRIEGLIFDAGAHSEYLLKVGEAGKHVSHADNPIILQDLFFRIGGTTDVLTKADNALEINSDDVIGDHFWIWRADHGAGVEWYGNESKHGLIVNGDNVICYALFNEHFQSYHTLWNGENGKTYFYQNETCYDPISQDKWMSHKGTVNGYSSYKVSNKVNKHYAVGLGIYNVFIYTGPTYDSSEVKIQLDNAIEVPNKPGVLVENACAQTFANGDSALQKINSIVNGVGYGVSSGRLDEESFETGEGWSRKFLIFYRNGRALYGKMPGASEKGKYIGVESKTGIPQPMNEEGDVDLAALQELYVSLKEEKAYTSQSWASSGIAAAKEAARIQLEDKGADWAVQADVDSAYGSLKAAMAKLVAASPDEAGSTKPEEGTEPAKSADLTALQSLYTSLKEENAYTSWSWKSSGIVAAKKAAKVQLDKGASGAVQADVDIAYKNLKDAMAKLVLMPQNYASVGTGTTSLKMSWKKDKDIDKYKLILYNKNGKKLKAIKTEKSSYKFTKLSKLTIYQVGISAIKMDGKKELVSQEIKIKVSTSPAKAVLNKFTKSSSRKAKVTWKKVKGADGYEIYLKAGKEKYKKVKAIAKGSVTSYTISNLKKNTAYIVKVRAYRKVGNTKAYGAYSKTIKLKM